VNPVVNYLATGAVIFFLAAFLAFVGYITYRVLRYRERFWGDTGEPVVAPPPPPPDPPARPSRGGRRRR
jgi:hypothetical protein